MRGGRIEEKKRRNRGKNGNVIDGGSSILEKGRHVSNLGRGHPA